MITLKSIFRVFPELLSNLVIIRLKQETQDLKQETQDLKKEIHLLKNLAEGRPSRRYKAHSPRPLREDLQVIKEIDGYLLGERGSLTFVLDTEGNPISDGFHEIDLLGKFGNLGALTYKLGDDFETLSEGYHSIDPKRRTAQIGSKTHLLDKDWESYESN